ncbi:hypothetical protein [Dryocola sp. BD586]|uniref:hypothetical protein n=1 Tax=Dryocola sp. BD586 TaxID=3133271 RepID=UPI003F504CFD
MAVSREFLLSVYERCNEHLRDQSTKRDQAIAFYLVVISFYFGSYSNVTKFLTGVYAPALFNVVMVLISGMTIRTLSGLRSWHMQYSSAILLLNMIIARDILKLKDVNRVSAAFFSKKDRLNSKMEIKDLFKGIENRVVFGMIFISGLPAAMLMKELAIIMKIQSKDIAFFMEALCYLTYVFIYLKSTIMVIRSSAKHKTWIVNFGN